MAKTVEDIAHGVKEVLNRLSQKIPNAKVILLGVLPRGDVGLGPKAKQLNTLLNKLADNSRVYWLDMWDQFADSNGQVKTELYKPDTFHLVEKGYQVWQKSMQPLLSVTNSFSPDQVFCATQTSTNQVHAIFMIDFETLIHHLSKITNSSINK